jgi:hypothetical protein
LRPEHNLASTAALFLITHVEKPLALLIDLPGETKREGMIAGGEF